MKSLTPEASFIFRITHIANVPWILRNGVHCKNSDVVDPNFVSIGNTELIDKRTRRLVPVAPGGTLSDYVPFYFTPFSLMMYNIKTGYGVRQRDNDEIVIFVSKLNKLVADGRPFLFTDRHAYMATAKFTSDLKDLSLLPWQDFQHRSFGRDPERPDKKERYQAEALIYRNVLMTDIVGIAAASQSAADKVQAQVGKAGLDLPVKALPGWYFS